MSNNIKIGPDWILETHAANWQARDSQAEFVFHNQMWILGGWYTSSVANPCDVWSSKDGKTWNCVQENAPWIQSDLSAAMIFKDKIWFMGGRKLPGSECNNKVWNSANGINWNLVTDNANWSPRLAAGHVVFKNRMWLLGGNDDFYDYHEEKLHNDVWSSVDGREWQLETASAPWSKRTYHQCIVFNDKIWVVGGGGLRGEYIDNKPKLTKLNDIWCSLDGVKWINVTDNAPFEPRFWFTMEVYRNRMWVLGGISQEHKNICDVWYSDDGMNWIELKSDIIWNKRHELASWVFKDKLWVSAGASGDKHILSNEVWSLALPESFFEPDSNA